MRNNQTAWRNPVGKALGGSARTVAT
jgi:hypothetical protein